MTNRTIRLIYPQWQGANIARWLPDLPPEEASRGYYLGSMLLDFLAPKTNCETFTVPVSTDISDRKEKDGILDKDIIVLQTKTVLGILKIADPEKVVTLGGECSVSVPVFSYLSAKYGNDIVVVWIDAHPDITLPGDDYNGYHAMALTAIMGKGDPSIIGMLPSTVPSNRICLAGLRECEYPYIEKRIEELGLSHFSPKELAHDSSAVIKWLHKSNAQKVMIHFDMDVMNPSDIIAAVADGPEGGLNLKDVVRLINDISKEKDLVALTIAEPMPRLAIRLKHMLSELPLL